MSGTEERMLINPKSTVQICHRWHWGVLRWGVQPGGGNTESHVTSSIHCICACPKQPLPSSLWTLSPSTQARSWDSREQEWELCHGSSSVGKYLLLAVCSHESSPQHPGSPTQAEREPWAPEISIKSRATSPILLEISRLPKQGRELWDGLQRLGWQRDLHYGVGLLHRG